MYQELLSLEGGTFNVIWILGCKKDDRAKDKDLTMSTICNIDLTKVAKHLSELLRGPRHMSLFLASTVTSGTIECLYIQVSINSLNLLDTRLGILSLVLIPVRIIFLRTIRFRSINYVMT